MELERINPEQVATLENMISMSGSRQISTSEMIDMSIEHARDKKKTVESKVDSVTSLMREVERMERAAEQAKQQSDEYSLDILVQVDDLKRAAQRAKEKNDMQARQVYAQKAALATEMKQVQLRMLGVLNEGNGSLSDLDEIRRSLEKRLSSALLKKEAADKQKLENEALFAYQKNQMEMAVQEAKRIEQEAMENSQVQEFLRDRGHVVDMLHISYDFCRKEISCIRDLLKEELEDDHMAGTEEALVPILQGPLLSQGCECGKCNDILECVKGTVVVNTRNCLLRFNRILKRHLTNAKNKTTKKWIEEQIAEAITEYEQDKHYGVDDFDIDIVDDYDFDVSSLYGSWA